MVRGPPVDRSQKHRSYSNTLACFAYCGTITNGSRYLYTGISSLYWCCKTIVPESFTATAAVTAVSAYKCSLVVIPNQRGLRHRTPRCGIRSGVHLISICILCYASKHIARSSNGRLSVCLRAKRLATNTSTRERSESESAQRAVRPRRQFILKQVRSLPDRLMAGRLVLVQEIGVRVPVGQQHEAALIRI